MAEKIIEKEVVEQYTMDMQRYSIYVSRRRVTPEYRDGLKPIHRRILYCMYNDIGCINNTVKSASVVGRTLERYHPHSDAAVYDAMKPMINDFEINMPLIVGQGNFGDASGTSASASRYTEVKMSKFAYDCVIGDLKLSNQVIDWAPNYSNDIMEPEYLPVAVPLLLINGAFGIGVGMKVEIPCHSINDVIDATINLIYNPEAPVELIPDQCMPCEIFRDDFRAISNKGYGSFTVRGIIDIDEYQGKPALIIRSTPDMVFLNSIMDKIETLVSSNKIIQIQDSFDKSTVNEMKYIIVLKRGADPNYVREVIYKNTDMEKTCRVNFEVLDGITPLRMSYKSYLLSFIEFRKVTKFRLICNELQKVQTKIHERDAYIKVLESGEIDNIIQMIKNQTNTDDNYLVEYLVNRLKITDLQASFILGSNIKKLSLGYLNKYKQDAIELEAKKNDLLDKVIHDERIIQEIIDELLMYKEKYGRPRKSKIISNKNFIDIPRGEFKIIITENNFIKKVPINDSIGSFRGDNPKRVIAAENTENILIFDNQGKVFKLPVHKIPFTDRNTNGTDIRILIKGLTSDICSIMYEPTIKTFEEKISRYFMVVVTRNGNIKKMDLGDFLTVPPSGIIYIKTDPGDFVCDILILNEKADLIVYSDRKALRMSCVSIPHLKRSTKGSRCMSTNDPIDGISAITNNTTDIVVITKKGYVNRFSSIAMQTADRGSKGSNVIKLSKDDVIEFIAGVNEKDSIRIITKNDKIVIPVSEIQPGSSVSPGKKMISLKGDLIIKCDTVKG